MKFVFYLRSKHIFVCINHRIRFNLIICDVHKDIIGLTDEKLKLKVLIEDPPTLFLKTEIKIKRLGLNLYLNQRRAFSDERTEVFEVFSNI